VIPERQPRKLRGALVTALFVVIGLLLGAGGFAVWQSRGTGVEPEPSVVAFQAPGQAFDQTAAATRLNSPAAPAVEPPSARAALTEFLAAEAAGDAARAFPLLDTASRSRVSSVEAWSIGRNDRVVPLTFSISEERPSESGVVFLVETTHEPALDAFRGYVPAKARQRWDVRNERGTWRVSGRPVEIEPVLPAATTATEVVQRWIDARAACDTKSAEPFQRGAFLYGPRFLLEAPCSERGTWSAGAVTRLADAPDVSIITSAFGPDSGAWARLVPVRGPRSEFFAVVAAFADDWRVVALVPGEPERT
jgi:hypothetical protein